MHGAETQVTLAGLQGRSAGGNQKPCAGKQTQVRSGCGAEFIQNKSFKAHQNIFSWDFPRAVLWLRLPVQGVRVRFLVWELRSHMLHGALRKNKNKNKTR